MRSSKDVTGVPGKLGGTGNGVAATRKGVVGSQFTYWWRDYPNSGVGILARWIDEEERPGLVFRDSRGRPFWSL